MIIRKPDDIRSSDITPEAVYLNRRTFMGTAGSLALGAIAMPAVAQAMACAPRDEQPVADDAQDKVTDYEDATTYNNYYEFGTDKDEPARNAKNFRTSPWTVQVDGLVKQPKTYAFEDLLKGLTVYDRTYRMRCVEAWSMVIPWQGVQLRDVISRLQPLPSAKFIEMTTLLDPEQMPGQKRNVLPWPYKEGLRLDEANHTLTLLATGMYGKSLPNQNGAPLRLVVPWKYGFKGVKSIVRIRFTDTMPSTTWNEVAPDEYGFYANVNPNVDHPRWSQAKERRIGQFLRINTQMFNGYAEVASMYAGMDLRKFY